MSTQQADTAGFWETLNRELTPESGLVLTPLQPADALTEKEKAVSLIVRDLPARERAAAELVRLKALMEEAHARFDPIVERTNAAHKEACKQRTLVLQPLDEAYRLIGGKVGEFDLAERIRAKNEEQRQIDEANRLAAESREVEIESAESAGASREEIAALCEMPLVAAPVMAARRMPTGPVSSRSAYKARVTNKLALVQYIANNVQYLHLLDENQSGLNNLARALGTAMKIPGVEVVQEAGVVTRLAQKGAR